MVDECPSKILLVEDNPGDARLFREMLYDGDFQFCHVEHVERLEDALARLESDTFEVVALDLSLPDATDIDGLIKIHSLAPSLAVVVVSRQTDENLALKAVRAGAQDYLLKGRIDGFTLTRCLRHAIERARLQDQLARLAQLDELTGLANRKQFRPLLKKLLHQARRGKGLVGLLLLDLDGFKGVNDTFGHPIGDKLLKAVAQRLLDCVRESDFVVRLGGDEFAVIATGNDSADGVASLAKRIIGRLSQSFSIDGNEIAIGTSIGITTFPGDQSDADGLLHHADVALYRAKGHGRGRYSIYDEDMDRQVRMRQSLEADLRKALSRDEITLFYQPQFAVGPPAIIGVEALLRWHHPQRGLVPPSVFLPLAEKNRLIMDLDAWALETASRQAKAWQSEGLPPFAVSVNVSAANFERPDWAAETEGILRKAGVDPYWMELEITESVAMSFRREAVTMVECLVGMGVRIAIDDFGTGYSSLAHLKCLPVHRIKIDQSFVRSMTHSWRDAAICFSVIQLAHSLQMQVIAEGVELKSELDLLIDQGCNHAQGFYFAKPMPTIEMTDYLRERAARPTKRRAATL